MVAIFSPTSPTTVRAETLEREINEIAAALHRKRQIKNIEQRLNAIAHNLGKVEASPQQKRLREDLLAVAAAAGIFLSVATASNYTGTSLFNQHIQVTQTHSSVVRTEVKPSTLSEVRKESSPVVRVDTEAKITAFMRAIIGQESAGKFDIVNPHSGAIGYGQLMPENVAPWTREALGYVLTPKEFRQSPKLQIKTIKHQLTKIHGSQVKPGRSEEEVWRRVAATWYSGKPWLWDNTRPQPYNGHPYPSIAEYTKSVWQRYLTESRTSSRVHTETEARTTARISTEVRPELKPQPVSARAGIGNLLLNYFQPHKAQSIPQRVVDNAIALVGSDYKPGQKARCADFVRYVLKKSGLDVGVTTNPIDADKEGDGRSPYLAQSFFGADIGQIIWSKDQLKPGDLVAFADTYGNYKKGTITHVGIYIGNGMMVDRSTSSRPIFRRPIATFKFLAGVRPHAYKK
jgi:cell wall-associated NlpC family hydrolase